MKCARCEQEGQPFEVATQVCTQCASVFSERPAIEKPAGFNESAGNASLTYVWAWYRHIHLAQLLFVSVVLAFAFWALAFARLSEHPLYALFLAPFVFVALWESLSIARGLFNRSTLMCTPNTIKISHGPVPNESRTFEVDVQKLSQLFAKAVPGRLRTTYEVHAILDDEVIVLVDHLRNQERALYLEQSLERFLKIKDRAVPGEIERKA